MAYCRSDAVLYHVYQISTELGRAVEVVVSGHI